MASPRMHSTSTPRAREWCVLSKKNFNLFTHPKSPKGIKANEFVVEYYGEVYYDMDDEDLAAGRRAESDGP